MSVFGRAIYVGLQFLFYCHNTHASFYRIIPQLGKWNSTSILPKRFVVLYLVTSEWQMVHLSIASSMLMWYKKSVKKVLKASYEVNIFWMHNISGKVLLGKVLKIGFKPLSDLYQNVLPFEMGWKRKSSCTEYKIRFRTPARSVIYVNNLFISLPCDTCTS